MDALGELEATKALIGNAFSCAKVSAASNATAGGGGGGGGLTRADRRVVRSHGLPSGTASF